MNKKIALFTGTSRDDVEKRVNYFMGQHNVVDVQVQTCYFNDPGTAHFTIMVVYEV